MVSSANTMPNSIGMPGQRPPDLASCQDGLAPVQMPTDSVFIWLNALDIVNQGDNSLARPTSPESTNSSAWTAASDLFSASRVSLSAPTTHPSATFDSSISRTSKSDLNIPSRASSIASSSEDEVEEQMKMISFENAPRDMESDEDEISSSSQGDVQRTSISAQPILHADIASVKVPTTSAVHISAPSFSDLPTLQDSAHASAFPCVPTSLPPTTKSPSSPHKTASAAPVSHPPPSTFVIVTHTVEPAEYDRDPLIPSPSPCAPTSSLTYQAVALKAGATGSTNAREMPRTRSSVKALTQQTPEPVQAINTPADPTDRPSPIDRVPIDVTLTDVTSIDAAPIEIAVSDASPIDAAPIDEASFESPDINVASNHSTKLPVRDTVMDPTTNKASVDRVFLNPLDLATRSLYLSFRTGPDLLKKPEAPAAHTSDQEEETLILPKRKPGRTKKIVHSDGEKPDVRARKPVWRSTKEEKNCRCIVHLYCSAEKISRKTGRQSKEASVHKGKGEESFGRNDPNERVSRQSRANCDVSRMVDDLPTEIKSGSERGDCGDDGKAEIPPTQRIRGRLNKYRANPFIDDKAVESAGAGNGWEDSIREGLSPPRKRPKRQAPAKDPRATPAMRIEDKTARERETLAVCCRINGDPPSHRYREPALEPFLLEDDKSDVEYAEDIPLTFPQARQNRIVLARQTASPPPSSSQPRLQLHHRLPQPSPSPRQPTGRLMASQPFPSSSSRPSVSPTSHREILSDLEAVQTALSQLSTLYSRAVQDLASLGFSCTSSSTLRSHGKWMNHYGQFLAQHATWENFATSQLARQPSLSQFASRGSSTSSSSSSPLPKQRIFEDLQEMKRAFDRASTSFHRVVRNLALLGRTSQLNGEWMNAFGQFLTYHGKWERSVAAALDGEEEEEEEEEEGLDVRQAHGRVYNPMTRMKGGIKG